MHEIDGNLSNSPIFTCTLHHPPPNKPFVHKLKSYSEMTHQETSQVEKLLKRKIREDNQGNPQTDQLGSQ
ncbi:Exophilin-5 [Manis pentadactyla]|nr:Exophilin-5 [Manis pentadactyla]